MIVEAPWDSVISRQLAEELADVECRFAAELTSDLACVKSLVRHLERYRGKRLRPMLVLLAGLASDVEHQGLADAHRVLATVVEMVHMATLVHDDILDEAEVRRRGATVNHLHGNETAVMLGDYLISHAYHLCSSLGESDISRRIAQATNVVCEGELLQLANRENWELDEATYFEIIRRKTASLCGVCCSIGATLSGAGDDVAERLYLYGEKVGQAFQMVDDLLDLTGTEAVVGKTLGRDLQKGKLTLPLIRHRDSLQGSARSAFVELLRAGSDLDAQPEVLGRIQRDVKASGATHSAYETAQRWVEQAKASLDLLCASPARTRLAEMADAVISRKH